MLNTLYASGMISDCTKSEFIQRMAYALGVPDMANNFKHLALVAQHEQTKDN